ncbi:MAG TPA: hypothetical protein VFF13_06640 [archaeon]|nr:hypothetical protein [archaeon]
MQKILFALIIITFFLFGCVSDPQVDNPANANDFEFTYSFGVFSDNLFDTETNSYTKDMVCEEDIQYTLELSEQEKQTILKKIIENNLLFGKSDFTENCGALGDCMNVDPQSGNDLKLKIDGVEKNFTYRNNYYNSNDPELKKYLEVTELIEQIIREKETQANIPQPTCGYM